MNKTFSTSTEESLMNRQLTDTDWLDDEHEAEYDDFAAAQFERRYDEVIAEAFKAGTAGRVQQDAYYDITPITIEVPAGLGSRQIDAALRRTVFRNVGQNAAAYGKFGGYSSLGRILEPDPDWDLTPEQFARTWVVESVYHIGD